TRVDHLDRPGGHPDDAVCVRLPLLPRLAAPFFFSSRRRHTRFSRDWSSDVCSSDLSLTSAFKSTTDAFAIMLACVLLALGYGARSEERRVGKEGRSRWGSYHQKKKSEGARIRRI